MTLPTSDKGACSGGGGQVWSWRAGLVEDDGQWREQVHVRCTLEVSGSAYLWRYFCLGLMVAGEKELRIALRVLT